MPRADSGLLSVHTEDQASLLPQTRDSDAACAVPAVGDNAASPLPHALMPACEEPAMPVAVRTGAPPGLPSGSPGPPALASSASLRSARRTGLPGCSGTVPQRGPRGVGQGVWGTGCMALIH